MISNTGVNCAHYLGKLDQFIRLDYDYDEMNEYHTNINKYHDTFNMLLKKNKIKRYYCGFIIMINNESYVINNIDHEEMNIDLDVNYV